MRDSFDCFLGVQCNDFDRGSESVNAERCRVRQGG